MVLLRICSYFAENGRNRGRIWNSKVYTRSVYLLMRTVQPSARPQTRPEHHSQPVYDAEISASELKRVTDFDS